MPIRLNTLRLWSVVAAFALFAGAMTLLQGPETTLSYHPTVFSGAI